MNKFIRQSKLPKAAYDQNLSLEESLGYYAKRASDPDYLNWHAMKFNICPKCGKDFARGLTTLSGYADQMMVHPCGFKIRESKYRKIVSGQITREIEEKEDD